MAPQLNKSKIGFNGASREERGERKEERSNYKHGWMENNG